MRLDDGIEIHSAKEMRERVFRLIDLLKFDFILELAHIDLQKKQTSFTGIPALGSLGVLSSSAQVDESFLCNQITERQMQLRSNEGQKE